MSFRLGIEFRATGVYAEIHEDCERVKITTPKIQVRRLYLPTPIGHLVLEGSHQQLHRISFSKQLTHSAQSNEFVAFILKKYTDHLLSYFKDRTPIPTTDLVIPSGTPFQKSVWQQLLTIPLGQTITYGELADQLNTSARAIGNACRENPLPIVIPCHRVLAKNGLGGYAGFTEGKKMDIKCWLLRHEGVHI